MNLRSNFFVSVAAGLAIYSCYNYTSKQH